MKNDNDSGSSAREPRGPAPTPGRFSLRWVLVGELGLGFAAIGLGKFFGISLGSFGSPIPVEGVPHWGAVAIGLARDLGIGVFGTLLPLALMIRLTRQPGRFGEQMRTTAREHLLPLLKHLPGWSLILLAIAAGWGEELFFRGFLYSTVTHLAPGRLGVLLAFWATSLLFGVCHWVHVEYAVLATAMGAYLALLYVIFDSLWIPIAVHAFYDLGAMWYLLRMSDDVSASP